MNLKKFEDIKKAFELIGEPCVVHPDFSVVTFKNGAANDFGSMVVEQSDYGLTKG